MEGFLLEKIKECDREAKQYKVNRKYEDYEVAAIYVFSSTKKYPNYLGEIYFIKHGKTAIASFSIGFSNIRDNKLIGEVIKYFKKQESTITIDLKNKRCTGTRELLCNRDVMKDLEFKVVPYPETNIWTVRNGNFYFELPDNEFREKLGWVFNNIKITDKLLKEEDLVIRDKIKSLKCGIRTLQKEINEKEDEIEKLEESQLVFKDMQKTIKDYIGEDEWSAQKLLFEFTKGSFK